MVQRSNQSEFVMETMSSIKPDAARVLTTEEFLLFEKQEAVKALVDRKMAEGKSSRRQAWVMLEILEDVRRQYGKAMVAFAKSYIVTDVCGMQT